SVAANSCSGGLSQLRVGALHTVVPAVPGDGLLSRVDPDSAQTAPAAAAATTIGAPASLLGDRDRWVGVGVSIGGAGDHGGVATGQQLGGLEGSGGPGGLLLLLLLLLLRLRVTGGCCCQRCVLCRLRGGGGRRGLEG